MADQKKHEGIPERDKAAQKPDEKRQGSVNKGGQGDATPGGPRERQEEDEERERNPNRDRSRTSEPGQGGHSS